LPDRREFAVSLSPYRRRLRVAACADATLLAAAASGLVTLAVRFAGTRGAIVMAGVGAFLITALIAGYTWWRRWTLGRVCATIEARSANTDNILVTAEQVARSTGRLPHPIVQAELFGAAFRRLQETPPGIVQPLVRPLAVAAGAFASVVALAIAVQPPGRGATSRAEVRSTDASTLRAGDLRVVVMPPEYAHMQAVEALNPPSVSVLEGSRIHIETPRTSAQVALVDTRDVRTPFTAAPTAMTIELVATSSQPLIIRFADANATSDRFLHVRVEADRRPSVRIARPAQDLAFPAPAGHVPIEIEAQDDVGLVFMALIYTVVSGSGEALRFQEGEWPIEVARQGAGDWKARARLPLDALKLQDGDTVVYRAIARDAKPGADPSASESFLIEIGRLAGVAATGFALPEDRDRQGLSQQMLIIKTERLHAERATLPGASFAEQARLLAVEQRMVRAEFVFMTGGEVADEIEEAAGTHELAEGRLENPAQVDLLTAIREMSRAEARLNDADTARALTFERAALAALERAFDRRRYLLRTLPERTRIDPTRRLTGDLATARSSSLSTNDAPADPFVSRARDLLRELFAARSGPGNLPLLAARMAALDPSSDELQSAAVSLAAAADPSAREAAEKQAERAIMQSILARLTPGYSMRLRSDSIAGRVADELRRTRGGIK
jgi:hypothetical protein